MRCSHVEDDHRLMPRLLGVRNLRFRDGHCRQGSKPDAADLPLRGARGSIGACGEFLDVWRRYATNILAYQAIPCGHYIQEEMPEKVLDHFTRFFGS